MLNILIIVAPIVSIAFNNHIFGIWRPARPGPHWYTLVYLCMPWISLDICVVYVMFFFG